MAVSVVLDCRDPHFLVPFWGSAFGYRLVDRAEGYRILAPADGEPPGPILILQPVPEERSGKNRMHLDVHLDDPGAHIRRLDSFGARRLGTPGAADGVEWQAMADREGHEFCVVAHGRLDLQAPGGDA
ncbi:MAG: VOC family protein [Actinomycetia bacterium]|nr:VOC family protein [Actinomycetes bacterium]